MSSLSSVFNSCSTLITFDFYKRKNPDASEKQLVRVGQVATIVLVCAGLLWIPLMKHISSGLFTYLQSVQAYISPPIAAVFLLGIFIRRINNAGAMSALIIGAILGVARLGLEMVKDELSGPLFSYADINFLHFALFLFVICSAILIIVSLMTARPDYDSIKDITHDWGAKMAIGKKVGRDAALSIGLLVIIGIIWSVYS